MIVAKKFKWEAAHRLPWHESKCKHLHGHSYKMVVELEGQPDEKGFVIDFNELKKIIEPHISRIDHTTIISESDTELKDVFDRHGWKYYLLPFDSTAENLCNYFSGLLLKENRALLEQHGITSVSVKIMETDTAYACSTVTLQRV